MNEDVAQNLWESLVACRPLERALGGEMAFSIVTWRILKPDFHKI